MTVFLSGLKLVLERIPKCRKLDADEIEEHMKQPGADGATFPFGRGPGGSRGGSGRSGKRGKTPPKKGKTPIPAKSLRKYSTARIPRTIERLVRTGWPLEAKMRSRRWRKKFCELISAALAKNTWCKYRAALRKYDMFCGDTGLKFALPLSQPRAAAFVLWAGSEGKLGAASLKSYLSALSSLGGLFGGASLGKGACRLLLNGLKNQATGKLGKKIRKPATFLVLRILRKELWSRSWKEASKVSFWSFCVACYFGSFRAGELLAKKDWKFDGHSDLIWSDVTWKKDFRGGTASVEIRIRSPKVAKAGGEVVELHRFGDPNFCPVLALERLLRVQKRAGIWRADRPVYRLGSGKNLSITGANRIIRKLLKNTAGSGAGLTVASFRSGVPTDMQSRPDLFADSQIRSWGRWRSNAFYRYMKGGRSGNTETFDRLSRMLLKET